MIREAPYIVHRDTMAVIPGFTKYNNPVVDVFETSQRLSFSGRSTDIIKESCRYYGASLGGRQEGTKNVTGYDRLLPVAVSPEWGLYVFPVGAPKKPTCIWLAYHHIDRVESIGPKGTNICFGNGEMLALPVTAHRIKTQLFRTAHFKNKLAKRLESIV